MPAKFGWYFVRSCEIVRIIPPLPCEHVLPGGELNQSKWVGPARGGREQVWLCEWEPIWERRHLSSKFGERWLLVDFALPRRYFGLLGGGEARSGAEGSQFVEGRHLSPILSESGLQPIVCCQPVRSVEGRFLAMSPGLLLAVLPGFLTVLSGFFVSGFWSWLSWLCDRGIVPDSDHLLRSSTAARINDTRGL